jgi:hypothetical protein
MVAERKRVDRLIQESAHASVSPPVLPQRGHENAQKITFVRFGNGLSKPTDDVGQQSNDKIKGGFSQSSNIEKQVKSKIEAYEKKFLVKF